MSKPVEQGGFRVDTRRPHSHSKRRAQWRHVWAVASGMINGFDDGTLRPADSATRAQAVKILICFMDSLGL